MSGADLDRIKANIKEKAAAELNARGEKAADAIMGKTSGSAGIQFEDVEGVGDEARFALTVGAGDLHVRVGNLYFTTAAYSGATMPMPERDRKSTRLNPVTNAHLVCRLLLEKKKNITTQHSIPL